MRLPIFRTRRAYSLSPKSRCTPVSLTSGRTLNAQSAARQRKTKTRDSVARPRNARVQLLSLFESHRCGIDSRGLIAVAIGGACLHPHLRLCQLDKILRRQGLVRFQVLLLNAFVKRRPPERSAHHLSPHDHDHRNPSSAAHTARARDLDHLAEWILRFSRPEGCCCPIAAAAAGRRLARPQLTGAQRRSHPVET